MLFFILFFLTDQEFNYLENAILSINRKGAQFIRELCCLILCRVVEYITEDGIRRYVHLGTGNYNDSTAKLYTDCGLLTCNPQIGEDATAVFNLSLIHI